MLLALPRCALKKILKKCHFHGNMISLYTWTAESCFYWIKWWWKNIYTIQSCFRCIVYNKIIFSLYFFLHQWKQFCAAKYYYLSDKNNKAINGNDGCARWHNSGARESHAWSLRCWGCGVLKIQVKFYSYILLNWYLCLFKN